MNSETKAEGSVDLQVLVEEPSKLTRTTEVNNNLDDKKTTDGESPSQNAVQANAAGIGVLVVMALLLALIAYLRSGPLVEPIEGALSRPAPTMRLPSNYNPTYYKIDMHVPYSPDECVNDLDYDCPYSGTVDVALEASFWDDRLFVHAGANIVVETATLILDDESEYKATNITYNDEFDLVVMDFDWLSKATSLKGRLVMEFTGTVINGVTGFYISTYTDVNTLEHRGMYASKFESIFARNAFPCLDEPAKKAVFQLNFRVPHGVQAHSNMLGTSRGNGDGSTTHMFDPSPKMSTYLAVFILGEFEINQKTADNGVLVRVIVPADSGMFVDTDFALQEAVGILPLYDEFFGVPYPLPKLDLAAVPDFYSGAMENWGLITFRTASLIVSLTSGTETQFQRVSGIISHEICHMWFGDLVTMKWWNDLWLNEGFASYMKYYGVDALHPEWAMFDQFLKLDQHRAMYLDALRSSHTLSVGDAANPGELMEPMYINQLFDAISYSKGASIIKLLKAYFEELGTTSFNDGLTLYLETHKYGNAVTADLWKAISEVSRKDVEALMLPWTNAIGFPVVNVASTASGTGVTVRQDRFLYLPYDNVTPDPSQGTVWTIPLMIQEGDKLNLPPVVHLMTHEAETVNSIDPSVSFPICNFGQPAYIRCNYSEAMWSQITSALSSSLLAVPASVDRAGLVDDAFAFLRGSQISARIPLDLVAQFGPEVEYVVWLELLSGFDLVDTRLTSAPSDTVVAYRAFVADILTGIVSTLGFNASADEGHLNSLLRIEALTAASNYGVPGVRETLTSYYEVTDSIDPNLIPLVFNTYVATGGELEYMNVLDRYLNSAGESPNLVVSLMMALTKAPTTALLNDLLSRMWTDIRQQDFASVLGGITRNPLGRNLAWNWAKENWATIDQKYGFGGFALTSIISSLCSGFDTIEMRDDIVAFFAANPVPNGTKAIAQSLEYIEININFKSKVVPQIVNYFEGFRG